MDFSEKFKQFQVKLQEEVQKKDDNSVITYAQDPSVGGIVVQIQSESFGLDEFLVVNTPRGADFIRLWRNRG